MKRYDRNVIAYLKIEIANYEDGFTDWTIRTRVDNSILGKTLMKNGVCSQISGPACKSFDVKSGVMVLEEWYLDGLPHRTGGPAVTYRDRVNGAITKEVWYQHGLLHREDGPAVTEWDNLTGIPVRESWWRGSELYRRGGPAEIARDRTTGATTSESHYPRRRFYFERNLLTHAP